jgi:hypothetical protein
MKQGTYEQDPGCSDLESTAECPIRAYINPADGSGEHVPRDFRETAHQNAFRGQPDFLKNPNTGEPFP